MASWRERYGRWVTEVARAQPRRPLWSVSAYRLALFFLRVCWRDVNRLRGERLTADVAGQLYRAVGSIGANVAEGYSRRSPPDRARYYEYALGSVRESWVWYEAGTPVLGARTVIVRREILDELASLLVRMIVNERQKGRRKS